MGRMSKKPLTLGAALLALGMTVVGAGSNSASASRVLLTNGETADVICREMREGEKFRNSIILRDDGDTAISAAFTGDHSTDVFEIKLRDSGTASSVRIWYDLGFHKEGMKTPLVVEVNDERFRSLVDDTSSAASRSETKMRAAVRKLPSGFLAAIRRLCAIADGGDLDLPPTAMLERLFDEKAPAAVHVVQKTPLSEAEIASLQARFSKR